ncbi:hypothetical protein B0I35DRAFT_474276 [Stachybotrys elegans]|uniref:Condensation domain-containing protein n=1 Tax=Stachybotrys elegans TaxID=80388 RepID=A0A8K0T6I4_9HYPO|nr:hypothetical protein B0I35DRAFT_474276 [Stachybotrys elegans]
MSSHTWKERDGVWRRSLGSMESFYLALATPEGDPVHWMIGSCITIAYRGIHKVEMEAALRQAWQSLVYELPNIAAVIERDTGEMVVDTNAAAIDKWLQTSFQVHHGITADELFSSFKSQFRITLHFLRDTNQPVIQGMHALIDGRGMLYLYHALFTALRSNDNNPTSCRNLTQPLDTWLQIPVSPSDKNVRDVQSLFQRFAQEKPIQLPNVDFQRIPQRAVHRELELSQEKTQMIVESCKLRGVSVTSAWHAAVILAVKRIQAAAGEEGTSYTQFTTIDLRRWFPSNFSPQEHSVGSLQTALPFAVQVNQQANFDAISQSLHGQYKAPFAFADGDLGFLLPAAMAMSEQVKKGASPSSTPSLSSMGRVDDFLAQRYGDWVLLDFWISSTMLTGDIQVYLWTWGGCMTLSVCYNEAFYETKEVDDLLQQTRDEMSSGLGIL